MFKNYFTPDYLFSQAIPGFPFHLSDKLYFQFGILLFVVGLALLFFKRTVRNPIRIQLITRWQRLALTIGFLAVLWAGFRFEAIRFFSMRVMVWLVYLAGVAWAVFILKDWRTGYQKKLENYSKEEIKKRYM